MLIMCTRICSCICLQVPALICVFACPCVAQEDARFEQVTDVRAQLKFFEQLDQLEKQRKEEQEREILMKAAKVQHTHTRARTYSFILEQQMCSVTHCVLHEHISCLYVHTLN